MNYGHFFLTLFIGISAGISGTTAHEVVALIMLFVMAALTVVLGWWIDRCNTLSAANRTTTDRPVD